MPGNAAFLTPGNLYINSGVNSEFRFLKPAFDAARKSGYTRFVEPACGSFSMSHLAQQGGWDGTQIEASDVILFSAVLGYVVQGLSLEALEISIDGFPGEDMTDPATVLWAQAVARARAKSSKLFWSEISRAMLMERDRHLEVLNKQLDRLRSVLAGLSFQAIDLFDHLEQVMDDPRTIVSLNPPSTGGGYEKFFDTDGAVTWKEPSYSVFDPVAGYEKLDGYMSRSKALLAIYEENQGGHIVKGAFVARGSGRKAPSDTGVARSINYYIVSNRPDEFKGYAGGMMVESWKGFDMEKAPWSVLPEDHPVTSTSVVNIVNIGQGVANYYRSLWTHNFVGGNAVRSLALLIDGYLVGVFGYDPAYLTSRGTPGGKDSAAVLLQFGMAVPQKRLRFGRLIGRLALCRQTLALILSHLEMYRCDTVRTAQLSKYPESKEQRGIMNLTERKRDPHHGYRLIYTAPVSDVSWDSSFEIWYKREERWQANRVKRLAETVIT
jgi:hypothetical protein